MTETHKERGHSPLGASGAERWMNCPGSVALLKELELPESDEPDYQREGTAMHEAAADCLEREVDTWEIVGETYNGIVITEAMAVAIQIYLDTVRPIGEGATRVYIEAPISSPVHEKFYGSVDYGAVAPDRITVVDLKGGEGIIVDPEDNPQIKYYAFGLIDGIERANGTVFPDETPVHLGIVQPRGFSNRGPVRFWETTVGEIKEWVKSELVPAMCATENDRSLDPGPWCRFCPAKLVCPLLTSLYGAAMKAQPAAVVQESDAALGRQYQYIQAVKFYIKALEDETFRRLSDGREVPGTKLVRKKANRVYKDGAADLAKAKFKDKAFTAPALKSPAELEKLGPEAAAWVKSYAYTPDTGLTVALSSDPKDAVKVERASEKFAAYTGETNVAAT